MNSIALKYKNRSQFTVGITKCGENLTQGEMCLLHTLATVADYRTGLSSPGNELLVFGCRVNGRSGVDYIMNRLFAKDLVEHVSAGRKYKAATYRIRIEDARFPEPKQVSQQSSELAPETKISASSSEVYPENGSQRPVTKFSASSKKGETESQRPVEGVSASSSELYPSQVLLPNTSPNNNNNTTALAVGDAGSKELQPLTQFVKSAILASEQKQLNFVTDDVLKTAREMFNETLKAQHKSQITDTADLYTLNHYKTAQRVLKKYGQVKYLLGLAISFRDWDTVYTIKHQAANRWQEPDAFANEQILKEANFKFDRQRRTWLLEAYHQVIEKYVTEIGDLSPAAIDTFYECCQSALKMVRLMNERYGDADDYVQVSWNAFLEAYDGTKAPENLLPVCQDAQTLMAGGILCEEPVHKIEQTPPSVQMPHWAVKDFDVWRCKECRVKVQRGGLCDHQEDCSHFVASESEEDQELEVAVAAGG